MANIDDLLYKSISDKSIDKALEDIRQIRLARKTPIKTVKTFTEKSKSKSKLDSIDSEQAATILSILLGGTDDN